jgi:FKBP-type peptidyl-prolyl cis-trans isomerase FklB
MKVLKSVLVVLLAATMFSCGNQKADVKSLETELDSASYALGVDMAFKIKANIDNASPDLFMQGYRNGVDSTNLLMSKKDLDMFLRKFFQKQQVEKRKLAQEKAAKEAEVKFAEVKKAGEDFLAENKTKGGVVTTASGLQYVVLKEGKGDNPLPTSRVKIHYHGTTINGEVFDSSVDRKEPYESTANAFIPGFNEGLALLKEGSKYRFFIPQEIAYGAQKRGELIKPLSALIFEVELLEILKK